MRFRFLIVMALCVALSGCVLKSSRPAFSDDQTELIFGDGPVSLELYDLRAGQWQKEDTDEAVPVLKATGHHYQFDELSADGATVKTTIVSFAPVGKGIYLVQLQDEAGITEYAMASWDGKQLLARGLFCSDMKGLVAAEELMINDGSECTLNQTNPTPEVWLALYGQLLEPDIKVVQLAKP